MATKRKRTRDETPVLSDQDADEYVSENDSEDGVDLFSSLTGSSKKAAKATAIHSDDEDEEIRASIAKSNRKQGTEILKKLKGRKQMAKSDVGGGSFQSMGLHPWLLRALTLRGYTIPTPIQRLAIPSLLASPPRDLVGMARTGSGKTLAYTIPLLQKLGGTHSTTFGARALILLPTRELALQVLKVGKELGRGRFSGGGHAGDSKSADDPKSQSLRWGLLIGGEGMDEQFEILASNPDVIIATPGRLLHLIVEANLDLRAVQYVVFDEADRLFEMGFETAMNEILHRLPSSRQTLLFSATLPKTLVEFAKAGLDNPKLVRLDAESKISPDLRMSFFAVKQAEKEACLLTLLRDIIKVPVGVPAERKGKEHEKRPESLPHQTIIFTATKHHVEYLMNMLIAAEYSVSHIYGSLDQHARTSQMERFRNGETSVLVVTDVAARGIDIPVLENVINYDFPRGSRVFVHRVGRTARAGRQGWAWSFVTNTEVPFLLDLQLFLGRPLARHIKTTSEEEFSDNLVLGPFPRDKIDEEMEFIKVLERKEPSLTTTRAVMARGQGMYERSQGKASPASYTRSKEITSDSLWGFSGTAADSHPHPVLRKFGAGETSHNAARSDLLKALNNFRPNETVLEIGSRGKTAGSSVMKERRKALDKAKSRVVSTSVVADIEEEVDEEANGEEIEGVSISYGDDDKKKQKFRDQEFYISHFQKDAETDKGYSLKDGASFEEQARGHIFSLNGDEKLLSGRQRHHSQLTWDRKKKKFIKGNGEGADNLKIVKTESGTRLPATYRSGRFEEWQHKNKVSLPRAGEEELPRAKRFRPTGAGAGKFRHTKMKDAKPLDKFSFDYDRRVRQMRKKGGEDAGEASTSQKGKNGKKSRYGSKPIGKVKSEIKSVDQIRKTRQLVQKRKEKNARPTHKKGRR